MQICKTKQRFTPEHVAYIYKYTTGMIGLPVRCAYLTKSRSVRHDWSTTSASPTGVFALLHAWVTLNPFTYLTASPFQPTKHSKILGKYANERSMQRFGDKSVCFSADSTWTHSTLLVGNTFRTGNMTDNMWYVDRSLLDIMMPFWSPISILGSL